MTLNLSAKEEAALICYVAMYDNCDKQECWKSVSDLVRKYGSLSSDTVYRGHSKKDTKIKTTNPFFSATPKKKFADLFVERDWSLPPSQQRVGHLFKIHLCNVPTLSTRDVKYTFSKEVKKQLKLLNKGNLIGKENVHYTVDELYPFIPKMIDELVFSNKGSNGEEVLVLNGGTFFADSFLSLKGYKSTKAGTEKETWYSF